MVQCYNQNYNHITSYEFVIAGREDVIYETLVLDKSEKTIQDFQEHSNIHNNDIGNNYLFVTYVISM